MSTRQGKNRLAHVNDFILSASSLNKLAHSTRLINTNTALSMQAHDSMKSEDAESHYAQDLSSATGFEKEENTVDHDQESGNVSKVISCINEVRCFRCTNMCAVVPRSMLIV